jgi:hypothetical protein
MSTAHASGSRRFALLLGVLAIALLALVLPGTAGAKSTQFCLGTIKPIKATSERDTGVDYEFSCHDAITSFALITSREIMSFDVSADVFDPASAGGEIRGDDRLGECEGEAPSRGFLCNGTYSGQGRVVRSSFDTTENPCARRKDKSRLLNASIVVMSADGELNGPYRLGKAIKGCPKPAKKKRAKKSSRHH